MKKEWEGFVGIVWGEDSYELRAAREIKNKAKKTGFLLWERACTRMTAVEINGYRLQADSHSGGYLSRFSSGFGFDFPCRLKLTACSLQL